MNFIKLIAVVSFIILSFMFRFVFKEIENYDPRKHSKISFYHRYLLIPKAVLISSFLIVSGIGVIIVVSSFFTE